MRLCPKRSKELEEQQAQRQGWLGEGGVGAVISGGSLCTIVLRENQRWVSARC